ncbi:type I-E CRISPR-associated protein Cas7/Cse4/CasC [Actinokineospora sp. 24-640]
MFLDIHALHTLPYSNVNRDGLGSPKGCLFGGVQRIRVSSQSWKRAARLETEKHLDTPTVRTRRIAAAVAEHLEADGWTAEDARRAGRAVVHAYGLPPAEDGDNTSVLLWVPRTVIADLAALATEHRDLVTTLALPELDDKSKPKKLSKAQQEENAKTIAAITAAMSTPARSILNQRSATISLLGRMLADTPDHTVDGATQVAHAFTVHEAAADYDYFTAVDDCAANSGAGHLATAEFASGTFYRYCTVNLTQLAAQLGDLDTALSVTEAWTREFLTVVPSGKKNSTAPATNPDLTYLAVRDAPRSLACAFEKAIVSENGYLAPACAELNDYTGRLTTFLGDPGHWSGHAGTPTATYTHLGDRHDSLDRLVQAATNALLDNHPHTDAA